MVAAIRSSRFDAIARTLAGAFDAVKDHAKMSPIEADLLMEAAAAHVRSAAPLTLLQPPAPLSGVRVPIGAGFYGVTALNASLVLVVGEPSGRDAALTLTDPQAEGLVRDLLAVRACAALEAKKL